MAFGRYNHVVHESAKTYRDTVGVGGGQQLSFQRTIATGGERAGFRSIDSRTVGGTGQIQWSARACHRPLSHRVRRKRTLCDGRGTGGARRTSGGLVAVELAAIARTSSAERQVCFGRGPVRFCLGRTRRRVSGSHRRCHEPRGVIVSGPGRVDAANPERSLVG